MLPLFRQLQATSLDLIQALGYVDDVDPAAVELCESGFPGIFGAALKMTKAADVQVQMPRVKNQ